MLVTRQFPKLNLTLIDTQQKTKDGFEPDILHPIPFALGVSWEDGVLSGS